VRKFTRENSCISVQYDQLKKKTKMHSAFKKEANFPRAQEHSKNTKKTFQKKFQSEALISFCKNKIVLLTFHGVILKSGNVKKHIFLFRL